MTSQSDMHFIMTTALMECAEAENIDVDTIKVLQSKKSPNTWYVLTKELNEAGKPVKVYFKKEF